LYSFPSSGTLRVKKSTSSVAGVIEYVNYTGTTSIKQDIISASSTGNVLTVESTTGFVGGGVQTITFDRPFSNIVATKTYYVATVPNSTTFTITNVANSSTPIAITNALGSALSPLAVVEGGSFTGVTREQAGATGVSLTIASGSSTGTVSSGTGIQKGQIVIGPNIPDDTFVHSISGTNIILSKAVTAANPTGVIFSPMGSGSAQTFTFSTTQPTTLELLRATSVPQISHWGSSVIMEGRYDDDRAYVYTVGTTARKNISNSRAILGIRVAPSVDNGIAGNFGTRELVNRMQLVLRALDVLSEGQFFVELVLNPILASANFTWQNVPGTSLAQYTGFGNSGTSLEPNTGETIFGFYAGGIDGDAVPASYDLSAVKEISNSILGGGTSEYTQADFPNPTGIFPDGPETIVVKVTNIGGGSSKIDARLSWTEAQA